MSSAASCLQPARISTLRPELMRVTVFYAWQSDSPAAIAQHLIGGAVRGAVARMASDEAVITTPEIDRDPQAVPGSPEIAATILQKNRCVQHLRR